MKLPETLIRLTAILISPPAPFSPAHFLILTLIILLAICSAVYTARWTSEKYQLFLWTSGLILACFELYKQLFLYFIINDHHYDWWYFPFQLCSIPMYLCLFMPLIKKRRELFDSVLSFFSSFGILGGFMALLVPEGFLWPYFTLTFHGFFWHFMLILFGLSASLRTPKLTKRNYIHGTALFFVFCLAATALNIILHPFGNADMFYLSPYIPSEQYVFHTIALRFGIAAGNAAYLLSVLAGSFLFFLLCLLFRHALDHYNKEKRSAD